MQVEAATAEQVKDTVLKQTFYIFGFYNDLPREQEAAGAGAGGGAGLAITGGAALELAGDLTHDGPGVSSVMCPSH